MAGKKQKSAQTAEAAVVAQNKADAMYELEAKDSPVLVVITKRLRAAKKKLKRVEEIEAIKATGKDINADQVRPEKLANAELVAVRLGLAKTNPKLAGGGAARQGQGAGQYRGAAEAVAPAQGCSAGGNCQPAGH